MRSVCYPKRQWLRSYSPEDGIEGARCAQRAPVCGKCLYLAFTMYGYESDVLQDFMLANAYARKHGLQEIPVGFKGTRKGANE